MKTRFVTVITLAVLAWFMSGCTSLKSLHVVGEPVVIDDEFIGAEGAFIVGEDIMSIKVVDSTRFRASSSQWDNQSESFRLKEVDVQISRVDDRFLFANVRHDGEEFYRVYLLSLVLGCDEEGLFKAVAFTIDADVMAGLDSVETNPVNGSTHGEKNEFLLDGSKEETDSFLRDHVKEIFSYDMAVEVTQLSGVNFLGESLY